MLTILGVAVLGRVHEAAVALLRDDLESLPNVLLVAVVAHLLGRPAWLRSVWGWLRGTQAETGLGRLDGFVADHRDGVVAGGLIAALVAWWAVGVSLVSFSLIGALLAVYLVHATIVRGRPAAVTRPSEGPGRVTRRAFPTRWHRRQRHS